MSAHFSCKCLIIIQMEKSTAYSWELKPNTPLFKKYRIMTLCMLVWIINNISYRPRVSNLILFFLRYLQSVFLHMK